MLTLGDHTVRPRYSPDEPSAPTVFRNLARNSMPMASPTCFTSGVSQVAAKPMACGKTVATSARATP